MSGMELQTSPGKAAAEAPALSDAFLKEFGKQPLDKAALQKSDSPAARLIDGHFDELANLADRRDGIPSWLKFSATPRTVSYNDLKEMEKLADRRLGLQNHYSNEILSSMENRQVGWSKVYGTAGGAIGGGLVRLAVPALQGRGALVTAGVIGLGAIAGYEVGSWIGQKSFNDFRDNSTYLSVEKDKYGDALGKAWSTNTKLVAGAEMLGGLAAIGLGGYRVAIGLGVGAVVTYLGAPIAYQLGRASARSELEREAELGRRITQEWLTK